MTVAELIGVLARMPLDVTVHLNGEAGPVTSVELTYRAWIGGDDTIVELGCG